MTLPGQRLAVLDIEDEEHPLLRLPRDWKPRNDGKRGRDAIVHTRDTPPGDCIKNGLVRENSDPVMIEDVSSSIHEDRRIPDRVWAGPSGFLHHCRTYMKM